MIHLKARNYIFINKLKMLQSNEILYSKWNNDECYTPEYWVEPIIKYINKETFISEKDGDWKLLYTQRRPTVIWCPFDKEESNFVKLIREAWYKVICSHIDNWQDFYNYEPKEEWDIIISNPPFTNKRKIFERAMSFNKPFALLMALTWLNDSAPKQLFIEKDLQLLMFDKRIEYERPAGNYAKIITFSSAYYCWNFLPKQIIMEKLCKQK